MICDICDGRGFQLVLKARWRGVVSLAKAYYRVAFRACWTCAGRGYVVFGGEA